METLEKARLVLRQHLLANKEKVAADLEAMRKKSCGNDVFSYVDNLSKSFSFENVITSTNEITFDYHFLEEMDSYSLLDEIIKSHIYSPPDWRGILNNKKDSENSQSLFFLI